VQCSQELHSNVLQTLSAAAEAQDDALAAEQPLASGYDDEAGAGSASPDELASAEGGGAAGAAASNGDADASADGGAPSPPRGSARGPASPARSRAARADAARGHLAESVGSDTARSAMNLWLDVYHLVTAPQHQWDERLTRFEEVYGGSHIWDIFHKAYLQDDYHVLTFVAKRHHCARRGVDTTAHAEAWHRLVRTVHHRSPAAFLSFVFGQPPLPAAPDADADASGGGGASGAGASQPQLQDSSVVGALIKSFNRALCGELTQRVGVAERRLRWALHYASVVLAGMGAVGDAPAQLEAAAAAQSAAAVPIAVVDRVRMEFAVTRTRTDGSLVVARVNLREDTCSCLSSFVPCEHRLAAAVYAQDALGMELPLLCHDPANVMPMGVTLWSGMPPLPAPARRATRASARLARSSAATGDDSSGAGASAPPPHPAPVREQRRGTGITQRASGREEFFGPALNHGPMRPALSGTGELPHAVLNARLGSISGRSARAAASLSSSVLDVAAGSGAAAPNSAAL